MTNDTVQQSVLLIGKSQLVLDDAVAGLRALGHKADATNDFTAVTGRFDARTIDPIVFGGQVPPDRKAELKDELRSPSSRSAAAGGEDRSMTQTDQAWDWGVDLRDEERSELEALRRTVAQLRTQLDQTHEALRSCRQRHQDTSQALRQLAEARLWRRRRVRTALRARQLL
jgi:hypothetical protein